MIIKFHSIKGNKIEHKSLDLNKIKINSSLLTQFPKNSVSTKNL